MFGDSSVLAVHSFLSRFVCCYLIVIASGAAQRFSKPTAAPDAQEARLLMSEHRALISSICGFDAALLCRVGMCIVVLV